jgi:hypothetical protein
MLKKVAWAIGIAVLIAFRSIGRLNVNLPDWYFAGLAAVLLVGCVVVAVLYLRNMPPAE